jgi:hypothetical protein
MVEPLFSGIRDPLPLGVKDLSLTQTPQWNNLLIPMGFWPSLLSGEIQRLRKQGPVFYKLTRVKSLTVLSISCPTSNTQHSVSSSLSWVSLYTLGVTFPHLSFPFQIPLTLLRDAISVSWKMVQPQSSLPCSSSLVKSLPHFLESHWSFEFPHL